MLTFLSFCKKQYFFLRDKLSILLIIVAFELNWSDVDKIFKDKLRKISNTVEKNWLE